MFESACRTIKTSPFLKGITGFPLGLVGVIHLMPGPASSSTSAAAAGSAIKHDPRIKADADTLIKLRIVSSSSNECREKFLGQNRRRVRHSNHINGHYV